MYSPGTGHTLSSCQESVWIIQLEGIVRLRIYRLTRIEIDSKLIEKKGGRGAGDTLILQDSINTGFLCLGAPLNFTGVSST